MEALLLGGGLQAAAWRAGRLGLVQAEFVLTALTLLAMLAAFFRAAVWRPDAVMPPAGPLVAPSEEVLRHAAREMGGMPEA
ncbi:hypothetical protein [Streptomyces sp. NPDC101132]|uniref:hypothetical protein n=1 Tax=Streptomyces sp. NPDC101132 TaxID=3366110 RepID=UPI0038009BF7